MWSESWFYQLYRQYCQVTYSSLHTLNRLPNIPHSYWLRLIAFTQSMKIPKFTNRYKFTFDFLVCRRDLSSPENCNYLNCCLSKTPPLVAFIFGTITNRNHIAENSPFMEVSLMLFPPLYCTTHTRVASNSKRAIFIQLYTNIITNQQMYCWFGIIRSVTMWPCARICAAAKKKKESKETFLENGNIMIIIITDAKFIERQMLVVVRKFGVHEAKPNLIIHRCITKERRSYDVPCVTNMLPTQLEKYRCIGSDRLWWKELMQETRK